MSIDRRRLLSGSAVTAVAGAALGAEQPKDKVNALLEYLEGIDHRILEKNKRISADAFGDQPDPDPFRDQPTPDPFRDQPTPDPFRDQPTPDPFRDQPTPDPFRDQPPLER